MQRQPKALGKVTDPKLDPGNPEYDGTPIVEDPDPLEWWPPTDPDPIPPPGDTVTQPPIVGGDPVLVEDPYHLPDIVTTVKPFPWGAIALVGLALLSMLSPGSNRRRSW